jgi:hypothetical protein
MSPVISVSLSSRPWHMLIVAGIWLRSPRVFPVVRPHLNTARSWSVPCLERASSSAMVTVPPSEERQDEYFLS